MIINTFLPYADFKQTAECLDYRRLGKQRSSRAILSSSEPFISTSTLGNRVIYT